MSLRNGRAAHAALTASRRGPRSPSASRIIRKTISMDSSTNATGSGANAHHSGVTRVLMFTAPEA
jgi:hypothetical protein